jgi:hypothetical protein
MVCCCPLIDKNAEKSENVYPHYYSIFRRKSQRIFARQRKKNCKKTKTGVTHAISMESHPKNLRVCIGDGVREIGDLDEGIPGIAVKSDLAPQAVLAKSGLQYRNGISHVQNTDLIIIGYGIGGGADI